MSWRGLTVVVGVTLPDVPASAAGSPCCVTQQVQRVAPPVIEPRLLSVDTACYQAGIYFCTPCPGPPQEQQTGVRAS